MSLPDVPIPTLPDETTASEEPSKIVPLQDYVTTLGGIIALPQDALDILDNLIQRDNIDADQEGVNTAQIEVPNRVKDNDGTEQLMPRSIQLRRISQADVSPNYTDPTDESSQDSQMIGTIYSLDKRPIPDKKLEKIVGLSL